jgi:hypothetical protein
LGSYLHVLGCLLWALGGFFFDGLLKRSFLYFHKRFPTAVSILCLYVSQLYIWLSKTIRINGFQHSFYMVCDSISPRREEWFRTYPWEFGFIVSVDWWSWSDGFDGLGLHW